MISFDPVGGACFFYSGESAILPFPLSATNGLAMDFIYFNAGTVSSVNPAPQPE